MNKPIFVSYAYKDRDLVPVVVSLLKARGILSTAQTTIIDHQQEIKAGDNISGNVMEAIRSASKVVIIDSKNKSQWVTYEAGIAKALNKNIVMVIVGKKGAKDTALHLALQNVTKIKMNETELQEASGAGGR